MNSLYYGLAGKITTVARAITILGFKNLCNLVTSASVVDMFKSGSDPRFNLEEFWGHSIAVAACSRSVAKLAGFQDAEPFFVAGLLHDVGKLVENQCLPEEFPQVLDHVANGAHFCDAELAVLGVSHDQIGRDLLRRWKLPEFLAIAVGGHHQPSLETDHLREAAVVHIADILCIADGLGSGGALRVPDLDRIAWDSIGLHSVAIDSVLDATETEARQLLSYLKPAPGPQNGR